VVVVVEEVVAQFAVIKVGNGFAYFGQSDSL
jgi:hypothetical protein